MGCHQGTLFLSAEVSDPLKATVEALGGLFRSDIGVISINK
jgi:hypothetical protein